MTAITATFSNGYTDTYKGKRAVKAAWMITDRKTGDVLTSGHSLDAAKAQKTAEGKVSEYNLVQPEGLHCYSVPSAQNLRYAHVVKTWWKGQIKRARANGYTGPKITTIREANQFLEWCRARNAEYRAAQREMVRVEVVAL